MSASREDLPFRPDFAARVVGEAGRIATRRRRIARAGVISAVSVVTGAFAFGVWSITESPVPLPVENSPIMARADVDETAFPQAGQTEPLDYMFPDATPLAQFADRYSTAATGAAARRNILFAEETGEDGATD
jgi:hypothetical protein